MSTKTNVQHKKNDDIVVIKKDPPLKGSFYFLLGVESLPTVMLLLTVGLIAMFTIRGQQEQNIFGILQSDEWRQDRVNNRVTTWEYKLEILTWIAFYSIIGCMLNVFMYLWRTTTFSSSEKKKHPLFSCFTDSTQPLWQWMLSLCLQTCVYVPLIFLAVKSMLSEERPNWLLNYDVRTLADEGEDLQYLRHFFYIFFAYNIRDLPACRNEIMFILHHVACMSGMWSTLMTASPGALSAALGIVSCEIGSLGYVTWQVDNSMQYYSREFFPWWPFGKSSTNVVDYLYFVKMTISNLLSMYFCFMTAWVGYCAGFRIFPIWSLFGSMTLVYFRQTDATLAFYKQRSKPVPTGKFL